ncbi:MAG TPA: hypothetical protein VLB74_03815 [Flavobacterium sp.]|uniref:Ig-like domain-containing protein n=1 Tax=Flavobacterium sp. TaxID=239 RepID=UPI002C1A00BE|nr:hypothetical protein [Flavobacterium sp.]HSD13752.1 hypothetical protein [Flavobacterium sp.]
MKKILLLLIAIIFFSFESTGQCTISGTSVNSSSINCATFSSCTTIYLGDGITSTNLVMNSNLDFPCLGGFTFVIRNNATIDFSNGNYNLDLPAGSSIIIETGGSLNAGGNCSASDLIRIGNVKVASCNGSGGVASDFPTLVTGGGFNVVTATATSVCGSGSSTITASMNPAPTAATTYNLYTVASGGTPFLTINATSAPYSATYTTPVIPSSTTYYVEATIGSFTTPRKEIKVLTDTNIWNGTTWSKGTPPTSSQKIVFAGNYSSSSDITGCSCQVNSGNVVINSGNTLALADNITVTGGALTFENNSSLLQTNASAVNSGNINYKRSTTPLKRYDYTYWSSPVANAALSQLATNSLLYAYSPSINNWVQESGSSTMVLGKGYIGRAPNNLNYDTPQTVETNFTGTPNNGTIITPIVKGAGVLNLIGNPYPSAINIDLFLTDAANSSIVDGTIYLWTHNTAISSANQGDHTYNYTVNDYAKYNLTGGVKTAAISGGPVPTGKIAAGQGFFIDANSAIANGNYTATFRNSMRVSGNNNQFFRNEENNNNTTGVALEKHRIWLSLSNTQGAYNESLVGYIQNATNELDRLFDGKTLPSENMVSIYSLLANEKLSIQGRALPFANTDIVPIGYTTSLNGDFTINLENFDGLFGNQNIYLFDNTTGIYHDLKVAPFTFTTTSGVFNNRFELRFTNETLSVDTLTNNTESLIILTKDKEITVKSTGSDIAGVEVRDLLGKLIYRQDGILSKEFRTSGLPAASQILLVKVTFDNKQTIVKKALMP